MVGNSSSAVKEAPAAGLAAVHVGNRQQGRTPFALGWDASSIERAVARALKPEQQADARATRGTDYGYGDGNAAARVVEAIRSGTP